MTYYDYSILCVDANLHAWVPTYIFLKITTIIINDDDKGTHDFFVKIVGSDHCTNGIPFKSWCSNSGDIFSQCCKNWQIKLLNNKNVQHCSSSRFAELLRK